MSDLPLIQYQKSAKTAKFLTFQGQNVGIISQVAQMFVLF